MNINETIIKIEDLEFKEFPKSSNVKIYVKDVEKHSDNLIIYQEKIKSMVKEKYLELLDKIYQNNNKFFENLVKIVSYVDFIKSGAKVAKKYNISPDFESEKSYLNLKV